MGKIAKGVNKINFTMLYGDYCYILIENFPRKFSPVPASRTWPALQVHVILIIRPLLNTFPFISCVSLFKLFVDKHFALNLTERLKSIFFPQ